MSVDGKILVRFVAGWGAYNANETAAFDPPVADLLVEKHLVERVERTGLLGAPKPVAPRPEPKAETKAVPKVEAKDPPKAEAKKVEKP